MSMMLNTSLAHITQHAKGECLIEAGNAEHANLIYLLDGNAEILKPDGERVGLLLPGNHYGAVNYFLGLPPEESVVALSDCTAQIITIHNGGFFFSQNPQKALDMMYALASEFYNTRQTVNNLQQKLLAAEKSLTVFLQSTQGVPVK